jgi:hypothetical protein
MHHRHLNFSYAFFNLFNFGYDNWVDDSLEVSAFTLILAFFILIEHRTCTSIFFKPLMHDKYRFLALLIFLGDLRSLRGILGL